MTLSLEHIEDVETLQTVVRLLERENARLHKRLKELSSENARLQGKGESEQLQLELANLQEQLASLKQRVFGESSERTSSDKDEQTESSENEKPEKKKQKGHGPQPQPRLKRQQVLVELDEDERHCRVCQGELQAIAGVTMDSERITVVRRQFVVQEVQCQKYRCQCGVGLHTAKAPVTHLPGGRYSLEFAALVAQDKYANHLPLARQCRMMHRQGLDVRTQTLWDQVQALGLLLKPAYEALREFILSSDVIGADETWWRLMNKGGTKKWWVWSLTTENTVWHRIRPSRSAATLKEIVGDFEGTLVCDGYRAYETLANSNRCLQLAHCWAHVRRKFVQAKAHYPQCQTAIELINGMFAIERRTRDPAKLEGDEKLEATNQRRTLRQKKSRLLLDKLRDWAYEQRGRPKSLLRRAIDYMLRRWTGLTVFVDDPFVPLDNNRTERGVRAPVLGRKVHYGSRSERGTEVASIFYSLLDTAAINGLDPYDYLLRAAHAAIEGSSIPLPLPSFMNA